MNRTFRAAELAAAALALCAGLSFAAPSMAEELHAARAVDAAAAAAEAPAEQGYLARMYNYAMDAIAGHAPAADEAAPPKSLGELVAAYEAEAAPDREQDCLANAVYFESRGEPIEGQLAVAQVVLNRASSGRYPTDLCSVITQPAQFSFIRHGRFPSADKGSEAWRKAVAVAKIAREKMAKSVPGDVLWYHATYVAPGWGKRLNKTAQIGLHIFYS
jgi:spore germination cell wall hydrolase CwlJ-like protein